MFITNSNRRSEDADASSDTPLAHRQLVPPLFVKALRWRTAAFTTHLEANVTSVLTTQRVSFAIVALM